MILGSKNFFFPSARIGPKTSSKGKLGLKKRLKQVSELYKASEKSYRRKNFFSIFDYNFFQRLSTGLRPR